MVVAGDVGIELYGRVALALEAERRSALHCRWLESHASRPKKMPRFSRDVDDNKCS